MWKKLLAEILIDNNQSVTFGGSNILEPAPIHWSPKILFSIFWKGMKRKSYDKTRFCVSHEGLSNGLGTFGLT